MERVRAVCIDDKRLPSEIPSSHRIKQGKWYTITHVYILQNEDQKGELAVDIAEIDLTPLTLPFEHWKADRFGMSVDDLPKLAKLAEECSEANNVDIDELLEESLVSLPMPGELI